MLDIYFSEKVKSCLFFDVKDFIVARRVNIVYFFGRASLINNSRIRNYVIGVRIRN